nr:hypothetical protein [Salmonid herpesvirus 1]
MNISRFQVSLLSVAVCLGLYHYSDRSLKDTPPGTHILFPECDHQLDDIRPTDPGKTTYLITCDASVGRGFWKDDKWGSVPMGTPKAGQLTHHLQPGAYRMNCREGEPMISFQVVQRDQLLEFRNGMKLSRTDGPNGLQELILTKNAIHVDWDLYCDIDQSCKQYFNIIYRGICAPKPSATMMLVPLPNVSLFPKGPVHVSCYLNNTRGVYSGEMTDKFVLKMRPHVPRG